MNDNARHITRDMLPEPTLRRLPWYLAYVKMLDSKHEEYVSSTQIAKRLNVDASQIAKDLSFLNIKGKTRIGYEVHPLTKALNEFLGFKHRHNAFVIGAGSLGSALMLPARQRSSGVAIAVIAVPSQNAQEVANTLIESNIKAIWNFTPYRIKVPRNVVLQNTSIYSDLAIMYNRMEASANNNILRK